MNISKDGIALIKAFEGCKLNSYLDSVKVPTIGYGATYHKDGTKVKMGETISQQEADSLLEFHINDFCVDVKHLVKKALTDNQFGALVSFAFNLGSANLEKSTLLKKVNTNPDDISIRNEFLKWNKAGGKVLAGLTRRRTAEADLYFKV